MSTFQIKVLAVVLMIIDHTGFFLFPQYRILRIIGRLSFPLFAFLIVKGYTYTRDPKKYFMRLFLFANIIQVPSLFMSIPVNIFYTLSFGLLAIMIIESAYSYFNKGIGLLLILLATTYLAPDYNIYGVLLIIIIHLFKERLFYLTFMMILLSISYYGLYDIQVFSVLAVPIMAVCNNRQGPRWKIFFYTFYPIHIVFLEWLSQQMR